MPTNAQTALQAAATTLAAGNGTRSTVLALADSFKAWLDEQDAQEPAEPEQRDTTLDAMVERSEPTAAPELQARRIGFGN